MLNLRWILLILCSAILLNPVLADEIKVNCLAGTYVQVYGEEDFRLPTRDSILLKDRAGNVVRFHHRSHPSSYWYIFDFRVTAQVNLSLRKTGEESALSYYVYEVNTDQGLCESLSSATPSAFGQVETGNAYTGQEFLVDGKQGQRVLVNVSAVNVGGCGHELFLGSRENGMLIRTVRRQCFSEPAQIVKGYALKLKLPEKKSEKFLLTVNDKATGKALAGQVEMYNEKTRQRKAVELVLGEPEKFDLSLADRYRFKVSVPGYKSEVVKLIPGEYGDAKQIAFDVEVLQVGEKFELKNIYFFPNTYAIRPESQAELNKLLSYMMDHQTVKLSIEGHTNGKAKVSADPKQSAMGYGWDFSGNEKQLSQFRAESVKHYLVGKGVEPDRLKTKGWGAKKMVYDHPRNQKQRDANKRVEVVILSL